MTLLQPDEFDVPVAGGSLRVCRWPGEGPTVVALHGITANALSFAVLAEQLGGTVDLVAPDLRGRAGSAGLPGPYGLAAHAADVAALLDHLGVERAVLVGHSMGGFVAALTAVTHPDRVSSVLLVDGGVAFGIPAGVDIDALLLAVIGPAMQRLSMVFPAVDDYLDFWSAHPALGPHWSAAIEAYALRDLHGDRSSCNVEAIRADAADTLVHEPTTTAYRTVTCPIEVLWAPRGLMDEPTGLYRAETLAGLANELVPDTNHYTILLGPAGAAVVADHIRDLALR
ncbi:alpha/beta hydrolase [Catellatospora sp. TT07R-123]|uniref:alpha/beta hydrolase n=1 Tax=Catellatospora sp. TT07R-123 TaxID=2733863 RepID=UPI0024570303|nr:alpha/beta hydrolase [Catellatospora sp. TT07R-123]